MVLFLGVYEGKETKVFRFEVGDMTILKYEKRSYYLIVFASSYLPIECHKVERFHDALK